MLSRGACVLTLAGKDNELTGEQVLMLLLFETVPAAATGSEDAGTARPQRFADQVLEARKKQRTARKKFRGVEYVPLTSNTVERLLSIAKHTLSLHRHGMLPMHLEAVLFLKLNRRLLKAATVAKVVHAQ
ncbi:hypothetical protein DVH05_028569 [Phytophthora capsici]|nr:hypothetical protein DVH05_028626 [Phytophthora capsici]KAG1699188.1 hypothetical protein DVH05_028594 [Phytophthora capsici]KAG1701467.1 hypothetical protein DVH05_028571 [Phytophthora capsici]KAG1702003.1 hypothetical protein DVH05_028569 [Phytophthora capsici]